MTKPVRVMDTEVFKNYFLAAFKNLETGVVHKYEIRPGVPLDKVRLTKILTQSTIVTFNGNGFDMLMIALALAGQPTKVIKEATNRVIMDGDKAWALARQYGVRMEKYDHIDLIEVAPGKASLKIYNGRLHGKRMQDLPIEHDAELSEADMDIVADYCVNDLDSTAGLYQKLIEQIHLREAMGREYKEDLRSKSDAQVAEAVIRKRMEELTKVKPERPKIDAGTSYKYRIPEYIEYKTPQLREVLEAVRAADFKVSDSGKIIMPKALNTAIKLGGGVYRMGIGGLHSSESAISHVADVDTLIIDRDVTSYYPMIILTLGLYPRHLGPEFLKVYRHIVDQRIAAKRRGDKVVADSLKITVNGSFGKLGSKWSCLYSPDLLIQTTVTGQLALLLYIERMFLAGFDVISANTDGVVTIVPKLREDEFEAIVKQWEVDTKFETEETRYSAIYNQNVNSYIAVTAGSGYTKTKGIFASAGLQKNPTSEICVTAVVDYLTKGTPLDETIRNCRDIRKFVTVRQVTGGALDQDDRFLGKAIRWYYSTEVDGPLRCKRDDSKVPRSEGAQALMMLPEELPRDIDYGWYVAEARSMLVDVGVYQTYGKKDRMAIYRNLVRFTIGV